MSYNSVIILWPYCSSLSILFLVSYIYFSFPVFCILILFFWIQLKIDMWSYFYSPCCPNITRSACEEVLITQYVVWMIMAHVFECLVPTWWTVQQGLGGVVLLKNVIHLGWAVRFQKPTPFPVCSLALFPVYGSDVKDLSCCSSTLSTCCHVPRRPWWSQTLTLWKCKQAPNKLFTYKIVLVMMSLQSSRKVTKTEVTGKNGKR